jgi:hypothetical protein
LNSDGRTDGYVLPLYIAQISFRGDEIHQQNLFGNTYSPADKRRRYGLLFDATMIMISIYIASVVTIEKFKPDYLDQLYINDGTGKFTSLQQH